LKIKILNPIDVPNWNDQVAELPGATIFHTSNWARVLSDSYGYKPKYFCIISNGQLENVIPMMEINSFITGKRGVSLPFSDRVEPLVADKSRFEEILEAIISFGRNNGWRIIDFHGGNRFFDTKNSYTSFISPYIDLKQSITSLFKGLRVSTRRNISKAQKMGVTAKISTSKKNLAAFCRLNCLTRKAHGLPPQPDTFFDNIHKNIIDEGKGFLCIGCYHGKVIAAALFLVAGKQVTYKYGASDKRYLQLRPNNLVMAEAISWASKAGFKTIDLGRTEHEHKGQLQYKTGWNANESTIDYFKIDIPSGKCIIDRPIIRSSYSLFKQLPVPVLKIIGNHAYRHVG
jgi:hypothetical protein